MCPLLLAPGTGPLKLSELTACLSLASCDQRVREELHLWSGSGPGVGGHESPPSQDFCDSKQEVAAHYSLEDEAVSTRHNRSIDVVVIFKSSKHEHRASILESPKASNNLDAIQG